MKGTWSKTNHFLRVLFDSGCSHSIIKSKWAKYGVTKRHESMPFVTGNGTVAMNKKTKMCFTLCEFTDKRKISWNFIVDETDTHSYDIIMGRDLLTTLKIKLDFDQKIIDWQGMLLEMRSPNKTIENLIQDGNQISNEYTLESKISQQASDRMQQILDIEGEETNLFKWTDEITGISNEDKEYLLQILLENAEIFNGTLGLWNCDPIEIELKKDAKPYATRPYPVPKIYDSKFKKEIQRFIDLDILERTLNSEWAAPAFLIPKKDGGVRFICDFRKLNTQIEKKPYPIPPIAELLGKMEAFTYVTSIDVSLGYHHIPLSKNSRKLCTITTPFGNYAYKRLPMGLATAPSYFQDKIQILLGDLPFARAYIDDILIISTKDARDHITKVGIVLERLRKAGLKVKHDKVQLLKKKMIYLGYQISTDGISPDPAKIKAILNLKPPRTMRQVKQVIGLIQYYRDLWPRRSHILSPIVELTKGYSKKKKHLKIKWTEECDKAFKEMKNIIAKETILAFPNFKKKFTIYTDASDKQLGAVIMQENRPLAFYSRKLTSAQMNYTVTEKELLSIVETLKEFRTILLGFEIEVYTDHVNLTYSNRISESQRVMRWRMIIEEFGPTIKYIRGEANVVADSMSRLPFVEQEETNTPEVNIHELFAYENDKTNDINDQNVFAFPLKYDALRKEQKQETRDDEKFAKLIKRSKDYGRTTHDDINLITYKKKIYVPKSLREATVHWYHWILCHPGKERLIQTIYRNCAWPGMHEQIKKYTKVCKICQKFKKRTKMYGELPPKDIPKLKPWDEVAVDLIGPYKLKAKQRQLDGSTKLNEMILIAMTCVDTSTGWFEIKELPTAPFELDEEQKDDITQASPNVIMDKSSARISQIFDQVWLSRYPRPKRVIIDNGVEFKKDFTPLTEDYGVKVVTTTIKNPQANAIIERLHQVVHNMMRSKELQTIIFDPFEPFAQLLAQVAYAIRASHHRILDASPAELVFNRDMVFNITHIANWSQITKQKEKQIEIDNERENKRRISHDYQIDDLVYIIPDKITRKYEWKHEGPYKILQVYTNGTVRIQRDAFTERINIRRLTPHFAITKPQQQQKKTKKVRKRPSQTTKPIHSKKKKNRQR